jgi:hypothetical protein
MTTANKKPDYGASDFALKEQVSGRERERERGRFNPDDDIK